MSASAPLPPRTVKCPICGKASVWSPENRWRPFCSQRCRQIDLGAWASDQYRVPGPEPDPGAAEPSDS